MADLLKCPTSAYFVHTLDQSSQQHKSIDIEVRLRMIHALTHTARHWDKEL